MNDPGGSPDLVFHRAGPEDVSDVVTILDDAAAWLHARGLRQWPSRFRPEVVSPAVDAGETWLVTVAGRLAGTVTVDEDDPAWQSLPGAALYVHRMAVRRGFEGLGDRILWWVAGRAHDAGRELLRLDCVADNPGLCRYYEQRGFMSRGEVLVGGAPGQRRTDAVHLTTVRRFEKSVVPSSERHRPSR